MDTVIFQRQAARRLSHDVGMVDVEKEDETPLCSQSQRT
jgi:hypothetical protein